MRRYSAIWAASPGLFTRSPVTTTNAGRSRFADAITNSKFAVSCAKPASAANMPNCGSLSWTKKNGVPATENDAVTATSTAQRAVTRFMSLALTSCAHHFRKCRPQDKSLRSPTTAHPAMRPLHIQRKPEAIWVYQQLLDAHLGDLAAQQMVYNRLLLIEDLARGNARKNLTRTVMAPK